MPEAKVGFGDHAVKGLLIDVFSPVLDNPQEDVLWVPPEQAFGRRKQEELTQTIEDYTTPFLIFYRPDTHSPNKKMSRSRLTKGFPFCLPGTSEPLQARVIPEDVNWIVNYYTNDRDEKDLYNSLWNEMMVTNPVETLEFPVNDTDTTSIDHSFVFGETDDLSDVEGWLSTGDQFRIEGDITATVYSLLFESDDNDPSVPPPIIKQVTLELFAKENDDRYFIEQIYEEVQN